MKRALIVTGHFATGGRKVDLHFIADELISQGWDADFLTIGLSTISKFKDDGRYATAKSGTLNRWFQAAPHLRNFIWMAPFHPFNLRKRILNTLSTPFFALYPAFLPFSARQAAKHANLIVIESGLPPVLASQFKRLNPNATFIYNAADRASTLKVHPIVEQAEKSSLPLYNLIRAAAQALANDFPAPLPTHYIPHGLQKNLFRKNSKSPYTAKTNAISVGNMLFDAPAMETLAEAFPQTEFHLFGAGVSLSKPYPNVKIYGEMPFEKLVPYLQHATVGIAPYRQAESADYLSQSSMKLIQYTYCRLPIVAPAFAAAGRPHVCAYTPEHKNSLINAFKKALAFKHDDIDTSSVLNWSEVTNKLLRESGA